MSTVDAEIGGGNEAAGIAEKENSSTTVIFRERKTTEHVLLRPLLTTLRVLDEQLLDHSSHDITGGDGVDADAIHAPLGGKVAAKLENTCLASVVGSADETLIRKEQRLATNHSGQMT